MEDTKETKLKTCQPWWNMWTQRDRGSTRRACIGLCRMQSLHWGQWANASIPWKLLPVDNHLKMTNQFLVAKPHWWWEPLSMAGPRSSSRWPAQSELSGILASLFHAVLWHHLPLYFYLTSPLCALWLLVLCFHGILVCLCVYMS